MNETESRAFADLLVTLNNPSIRILIREEDYSLKQVQSNEVLVGISSAIIIGAKISRIE